MTADVIIGPCSIRPESGGLEYTDRLLTLRKELKGELEIVMRLF